MSAYVGPFSAVRELQITYGRRGRGRLSGRPVTTPGAAAAIAAPFFAPGLPVEAFVAVGLNARHRPIAGWLVSRGTATESLVHPVEVLRPAIVIGALGLVIAHNHPSGEIDASPEDEKVTRRIAAAARLVGIRLLDSIIIGDSAEGEDKAVFWSAAASRPSLLDGRAADLGDLLR